jgi:hypothetical protein
MGIEGFVIGWAAAGYALSKINWSGPWSALFWLALGLAGGLAQWFGSYRQGRPLGWGRGLTLVAGWSAAGALTLALGSTVHNWLDPSIFGVSDWRDSRSLTSAVEGWKGLFFGAAGGLLTVAVRGRRSTAGFWSVAKPQAAFVGVGFAALGFLGTFSWGFTDYGGGYRPPTTLLTLLLAVLMGAAAYLEVRDRSRPTARAADFPSESHGT